MPIKKVTPPQLDKDHQELIKAQNNFMAIMLMQPGLRMYMKGVTADILPEDGAKALLQLLEDEPKITYQEIVNSKSQQATAVGDFVNIMVLLYEELYQSLELLDLRYEAAQSKARLIRQYVKTKKTELGAAMRENGGSPELLQQAKQLDELLNTIKEKVNG